MDKKILKASTLLSPVPPVLISVGDMDVSNLITIAWTGTINSNLPMTYISVRPERHSYNILKEKMEFVINLVSEDLTKKLDWCGIKSGKDYDKFKEMNFTKQQASTVSAPLVSECPINLECKVTQIIPLGTHDMFLAEITAVQVNSNLLDENNKVNIDKAKLIAYTNGEYRRLGEVIGNFGYSVKK